MNAEIKQQWIADLKSGKYQQCIEAFKIDSAYDALGLLIKQYNEAHPEQAFDIESTESFPSVVSLWAGITAPTFENPVSILDVMEMNDGGTPFSEIADFVAANL
ncbi:hypothetical protein [Emticicia sp. W12TSBA100-4]|uniref:hypothetical protein n=1 Tax=Emticicia sp. W12TSBA100-4 TaxID=3160965 RepID=UPI003305AA66